MLGMFVFFGVHVYVWGLFVIIIVGKALIQVRVQKEIHRWFVFECSNSARVPGLVHFKPVCSCMVYVQMCKYRVCACAQVYRS